MQKQVRSMKNTALHSIGVVESHMKKLDHEVKGLQNRAFELQGSGKTTEANMRAYEAAQKNKALQSLQSRYENLVFAQSHLEILEMYLFSRDVVDRTNLEVRLPKQLVRNAEKLREAQEKQTLDYGKSNGVDLEYLGRILTDSPVSLYQQDNRFRDFDVSLKPGGQYTSEFNTFLETFSRGVVKVEK